MATRCQTLGASDTRCSKRARFKVSSDAGWQGIHCAKHTLRVVRTHLRQVWNGKHAIYIQKFIEGAPD